VAVASAGPYANVIFSYFHTVLLFRSVRHHERRYLSEAGCSAFDKARRLYVDRRVEIVDVSVQRPAEHAVSESDLVVDACGVLIGLPSHSFFWSCDDISVVSFRDLVSFLFT